MAASGVLITRAAFTAHRDALAMLSAVAMAGMTLFIWRHGQAIERGRLAGGPPHSHPGDLMFLTAATILAAAIAMVVSVAT